ncbi:MAG: oligosaccharide flippase family protein [Lachnospiraceae bacterium]
MNQRKIGALLSYLSQFISILVGLLYTPIMIQLLGKSEYGLYELVNSTVSYLGLLSLGFGGAYTRYYSRCKVKKDETGIARLNGMFLVIFLIIAAICILCGVIMIGNIEVIFGVGLEVEEYEKAKILMWMLVFSMAVTFFGSVFDAQIMVQERFLFQKGLMILQGLCSPFITLPLLLFGYGSIAMVGVSTVLCLVKTGISIWYCMKKLNVQFEFRGFQPSLLKEMWVFTFFIFLNQIIDQVNWNVDKFLIGRNLGTEFVAVYGVGAKLNMLYLSLSNSVSGVFTPRINLLVSEKNKQKEINQLFQKVGRIQFLILSLVLTGFLLYGKEFICLWVGDGYQEAYTVALLLIIPVTVPLIQNLGIEVQRAMNKHKARSMVYTAIALVNVGISIVLIPRFGIVGAAFGTSVSLIVGNGIFMNIYYQKCINLDIRLFWKEILKLSVPLVPSILSGVLITRFITINNWLTLGIALILYVSIFGVLQWYLGMNAEEQELLRTPVKRILEKRRK